MHTRCAFPLACVFLGTTALRLLAWGTAARPGKDARTEAEVTLKRIAEQVNRNASGGVPFHLIARARIFDEKGHVTEASYNLVWAAPDRWRKEVILPAFSDVAVAGKDHLWRKRSEPYIPLDEWQLDQLMDIGPRLTLLPEYRVTRVRERKTKDATLKCMEIGHGAASVEEFCFEPGARLPSQQTIPYLHRVYEYGDWTTLGLRRFPRNIRLRQGSRITFDVHVEEFEPLASADGQLLEPPPGAESEPWCADMVPAEAHPPQIMYSGPFMAPSTTGTHKFIFYARVHADGHASDIRLLSFDGETRVESRTLEVANFHFTPATCRGVPVESEIVHNGFEPY